MDIEKYKKQLAKFDWYYQMASGNAYEGNIGYKNLELIAKEKGGEHLEAFNEYREKYRDVL